MNANRRFLRSGLPLWSFVVSSVVLPASATSAQDDDPPQRLQPGIVRPGKQLRVVPDGPRNVQTPSQLEKLRKRQAERLRLLKQRAERKRQGAAKRNAEERRKAEEERRRRSRPPAPSRRPSSSTPEPVSRLRQQLERSEGCVPMSPGEERIFNFKGDIEKLVKTISELTCKNFILTSKIRSQEFEILSGNPVSIEGIWRAFLSALEANDFTVTRTGNYYKIIQANDGVRSVLPIYEEGSNVPVYDRMVTRIWKLTYATDTNSVVNYLNIFKSAPGGQIHPFPGSNIIVATDYGSVIEKLERILEEIDRPGALEQVHVVPVQFASASEMAETLTQVFEPQSGGARTARRGGAVVKNPKAKVQLERQARAQGQADAEPGEGIASISKILADDRTNKLLIIASEQAFRQILALLRELDVPEDSTQGQIHVVRLSHADAEELSNTLSSLAQGSGQSQRSNARRRGGNNQAAQGGGGTAALFEGEVQVTADAATNSLVITASKSDFSSMKRVISELDVPRFQVFVEAVIMEVSTSNDRTLGVGWHGGVAPTIDGERSPIILSNTPNNELSSLINSASPLNLASLLGLAGAVRGPTLPGTETIVQGGIPAIGVVIQALQSTNNVNVVSTPHLLTIDNEEAEIQVNEQRPFPSGLTLGGLGGALGGLAGGGNQQAAGALGNVPGLGLGAVNFNREDIGLTLKLKPQINDEDTVRLEIEQELSDVAGIDQVTGQVITSNRSAQTVVAVRNQDSVVIGGLVRDRETIDEAKTPLLGDIPLIGFLFKRSQKTIEKVNLVLILTPYIIRGPDDFRKIFERKMEERREFVNRFYGTSVEFRAAIDWDRKLGPLAWMRQSMREELLKAENDGPGAPNERIIRPRGFDGSAPPEERTVPPEPGAPGEGADAEPRPFQVPDSDSDGGSESEGTESEESRDRERVSPPPPPPRPGADPN
jgi:general secretion pathway protein D